MKRTRVKRLLINININANGQKEKKTHLRVNVATHLFKWGLQFRQSHAKSVPVLGGLQIFSVQSVPLTKKKG